MSPSRLYPITGFDDCSLTKLEQMPLTKSSLADDAKREAINKFTRSVGQLVVAVPDGAVGFNLRRPTKLRVPAVELSSASFLGGLKLYQNVEWADGNGGKVSWDLNAYFNEHMAHAFGTAFVFVDRRHIVTCRHVIDQSAINPDPRAPKQTYFVFGRTHRSRFASPRGRSLKIGKRHYRRCVKVVDVGQGDADWALIKLDRQLPESAVPFQVASDLSEDDQLFVLQHPLGLPLKYSEAEELSLGSDGQLPNVRADVGSGSSGSPVLKLRSEGEDGYTVRLVAILNGGDVGFRKSSLRSTASGTVIDPALCRTDRPVTTHSITPADAITLPEEEEEG